MFNLDEYMLHQVLAIVGIVFLIFFIVGYIITAIFSKIMFDILGVRSGLAFILFINSIILIEFIKSIKGVFGRGIGELRIY